MTRQRLICGCSFRSIAFFFFPLFLLVFTCGILPAAETKTRHLNPEATDKEIQTALDELTNGGEVVLPSGKFEIGHPIILNHNGLVLRGSGTGTILHLKDKANCPVVILGSPLAATPTPVTHIRLSDLAIEGNRYNQQHEFWQSAIDGSQLNNNGIDVWGVDDISIERVACRGCRSGGLVTASTKHLAVTDFSSSDNQFDGLACYTTESSIFSKMKLFNNVAAGISVDLKFNNNLITDSELDANDLGIFMRTSCSNIFRNLTISNCRKHGVFMAQTAVPSAGGWSLVPGTECIGNKFEDLHVLRCGGHAFQVNNASCNNNVITGERFEENKLGGLFYAEGKPVEPAAPASPGIPKPIEANVILNPSQPAAVPAIKQIPVIGVGTPATPRENSGPK